MKKQHAPPTRTPEEEILRKLTAGGKQGSIAAKAGLVNLDQIKAIGNGVSVVLCVGVTVSSLTVGLCAWTGMQMWQGGRVTLPSG